MQLKLLLKKMLSQTNSPLLVEKNVVSDKQPIMFAVYQLLYKGLDVTKVAEELMLRPIRGEF